MILSEIGYITAYYVPGKLLHAADALSRTSTSDDSDEELQAELEAYVEKISMPSLSATPQKLDIYRQAQIEDAECVKVREYCRSQWPERGSTESQLKPYWKARGSLTLCEDILLYNNHIVVPLSVRKEAIVSVIRGWREAE